ncbi:MAG TPA: diguanylate cyclase [Hyphomicrobium sp.]|nr:diguanylate cyclase [Hyphomicrobium sp.]
MIAAARLVAHASAPMSLMIGREGLLVPNPATTGLFFEFAGGDFLGRPVGDVLQEGAGFYSEVLSRVFAGESCDFPDQPIRLVQNGERRTRWFNLHFTPVFDASGNVAAALGIASEVTAHVRRAHRLSESEQRLRHALESSGMVGVWDLDVKRDVCTADANFARMYGFTVADCARGIDDALFLKAIHPGDRERVEETLRTAIETRTSYRCRYRILPQGGALRWVITSAKPSYDDQGELVRMLGAIVDVTDQMETASALVRSRFQFETLTEALPQIVWSCDAEGKHDYFSARWSEFTGIPPNEIGDDIWRTLVHPDDWEMVSKVWGDALRNGTPYDIDYRLRHHSGEYRWLRVAALPIRGDEGSVTRWFGTSTDVHDAYMVADERLRLAQELERIATEDQLTEVLTRRAFLERASAAMAQASEQGVPVSLLMMDIDHFKSINDAYGHPCGDKVLGIAASRIKACVKENDLVGRLGGEEFGVLLNGCSARQAKEVADRICRTVRDEPIVMNGDLKIPVTVSIGATTKESLADDLEALLHVADRALYQAKAMGRDRYIFRSSTSEMP